MIGHQLVKKAEEYASNILHSQLPQALVLHNYQHTQKVVAAVKSIGSKEQLNDHELGMIEIAAWFHNTGYRDAYDQYLEKSKLIAQGFLSEENVAAETVKEILAAIDSAGADRVPENKAEKVLSDALKYHILDGNHKAYVQQLSEELQLNKKVKQSDLESLQNYLESILKYEFYTTYGKEVLSPARDKLKAKVEKQINKTQKKVDEQLTIGLGVTTAELKAMKKKLQKAKGRPERGIETMFRLTSKNHIDLSGMADSKANIMISVNSIIISIILGSLMQKLDSNTHLVYPTIIVLLVNLGSMIFSILSLRPNVSDGLFTREDIENQKTNLLFFGNFHKMKREDYHWGMNKLMENANFLYSNLIDDIYFLGVVLAKKYAYLRTSYNVFMYGIVLAVIAFIISIFFAEEPIPDTIIDTLGN